MNYGSSATTRQKRNLWSRSIVRMTVKIVVVILNIKLKNVFEMSSLYINFLSYFAVIPTGKLNFKVDSLKYYGKSIDYFFGSIIDLYEKLQDKPISYDGKF
jgi:hypothetical protein